MSTSKKQVLSISGMGVYGKVANYSALPSAASHDGETWICLSSQGTKWLPGSLGGTYYPEGRYYSTGSTWLHDPTPYQASQSDVNAGIIDDQFVSPNTFVNASKWATKEDVSNKSSSYTVSSTTTYANTKALVDGLATKQNSLGYTAEDSANKTGTITGNEASTIKYPTIKGFYDYLTGLTWLTSTIWGTWINGLTSKTTPVDADQVVLMDSADSNKSKKLSWSNIKATLKTYFDTLYAGNSTILKTAQSQTAVTGSTSNTIAYSAAISANTFTTDDFLTLWYRHIRTTTTATITINVYYNTANNLSGATLIRSYIATAATYLTELGMISTVKSSTVTRTRDLTSGTASIVRDGINTSNPGYNNANIDWTVTQYLIIAIQNTNSGDSSYIDSVLLRKN